MKKLKKWFLLLVVSSLVSCGIEGIEQLRELNPPLALEASMSSNKILLRFYTSNPESYFTGYNIYVASSSVDLKNGLGQVLPNSDFDDQNPTLWRNIEPSSNIIIRQITFAEDYDPQNQLSFENGVTYAFFVKAYSLLYNISSPPSNIAEVEFTN